MLDTYNILNGAFQVAIDNNIIISSPIENVQSPKNKKQQGIALTCEEQKCFLSAIKNTTYENFFLLCLYTGARPGEVLEVRWADINFDNDSIFINGTKNQTSARSVI